MTTYNNSNLKLANVETKLPSFNQLSVSKDSIEDIASFVDLIDIYNLKIVNEEQNHYILDGSTRDIVAFKRYWNS